MKKSLYLFRHYIIATIFILISIACEIIISYTLTNEAQLFTFREIKNDSTSVPAKQLTGKFNLKGQIQGEILVKVPFPWVKRLVKISADDCLNELYINNVKYTGPLVPYCNPKTFQEFSLPEKMSDTKESVEIWNFVLRIENKEGLGKAMVIVRPEKSIELTIRLIQMCFGMIGLIIISWKIRKIKE